ncbi:hypothetical protein Ga0123461_1253 [Mariprofundus aestuarium]|uniref:Uncharacterized protein n=1 Tax=Mariprofundus aestuarium TaxID=1921086 RepID=A0A2K8KY49_MARES|nr:hypothetical protein [Mariprofundus aestuarium]ATX79672.1 hypothetical protein Ga0123461_1253 [Mariprofundus aestuarium]
MNNAFKDISPKLKISGEYKWIDVRTISKLYDPGLFLFSEGKKEVDDMLTPILWSSGDGQFECMGGVEYWRNFIHIYRASHIRCFVFHPEKHSEKEIQEIKSICEYYLPARYDANAAEVMIEKYYTIPSFKLIIEENFRNPDKKQFTTACLHKLLPAWGRSLEALQDRKKKYGAVQSRNSKILNGQAIQLAAAAIEEKWNSFASDNNAPSYDEVMGVLQDPERIQKFNCVVNSGKLDVALYRLNLTLDDTSLNQNAKQ